MMRNRSAERGSSSTIILARSSRDLRSQAPAGGAAATGGPDDPSRRRRNLAMFRYGSDTKQSRDTARTREHARQIAMKLSMGADATSPLSIQSHSTFADFGEAFPPPPRLVEERGPQPQHRRQHPQSTMRTQPKQQSSSSSSQTPDISFFSEQPANFFAENPFGEEQGEEDEQPQRRTSSNGHSHNNQDRGGVDDAFDNRRTSSHRAMGETDWPQSDNTMFTMPTNSSMQSRFTLRDSTAAVAPSVTAMSTAGTDASGAAARRRMRTQMRANRLVYQRPESDAGRPEQHLPGESSTPPQSPHTSHRLVRQASPATADSSSTSTTGHASRKDHLVNYSTMHRPSPAAGTYGGSSSNRSVSSATNRSITSTGASSVESGNNNNHTNNNLFLNPHRTTGGFTFDAFGLDPQQINLQVSEALQDLNNGSDFSFHENWDDFTNSSPLNSRPATPDGFIDGFRVTTHSNNTTSTVNSNQYPQQNHHHRPSPSQSSERSSLTSESSQGGGGSSSHGSGRRNLFKEKAGFSSKRRLVPHHPIMPTLGDESRSFESASLMASPRSQKDVAFFSESSSEGGDDFQNNKILDDDDDNNDTQDSDPFIVSNRKAPSEVKQQLFTQSGQGWRNTSHASSTGTNNSSISDRAMTSNGNVTKTPVHGSSSNSLELSHKLAKDLDDRRDLDTVTVSTIATSQDEKKEEEESAFRPGRGQATTIHRLHNPREVSATTASSSANSSTQRIPLGTAASSPTRASGATGSQANRLWASKQSHQLSSENDDRGKPYGIGQGYATQATTSRMNAHVSNRDVESNHREPIHAMTVDEGLVRQQSGKDLTESHTVQYRSTIAERAAAFRAPIEPRKPGMDLRPASTADGRPEWMNAKDKLKSSTISPAPKSEGGTAVRHSQVATILNRLEEKSPREAKSDAGAATPVFFGMKLRKTGNMDQFPASPDSTNMVSPGDGPHDDAADAPEREIAPVPMPQKPLTYRERREMELQQQREQQAKTPAVEQPTRNVTDSIRQQIALNKKSSPTSLHSTQSLSPSAEFAKVQLKHIARESLEGQGQQQYIGQNDVKSHSTLSNVQHVTPQKSTYTFEERTGTNNASKSSRSSAVPDLTIETDRSDFEKPQQPSPVLSHMLLLQQLQQQTNHDNNTRNDTLSPLSRKDMESAVSPTDDGSSSQKAHTPKATMMMLNAFLAGRETIATSDSKSISKEEKEATEPKINGADPYHGFPPLKDDPKYKRFFKMLSVGMPMDVVKHAMMREGLDPSVMDGDPNKPVGIPLKLDPMYSKYFKMLGFGLPMEAVKHAMERDGFDSSIMDQDHNLPAMSVKAKPTEEAEKEKDSHRRARLHWKTLRKVTSKSLWAKINQDEDLENIEIDEEEFQELFQVEKNSSVELRTKATDAAKRASTVRVIDPKRANNGGIILARLKMTHDEMADAVDRINEHALTSEQIENIIEYLPSKEERKALESYMLEGGQDAAEKFEGLCECEKFMVSMMTVKHAKRKIRALLFKLQFETCVREIQQDSFLVESACDELHGSVRLRQLLGIILEFGNRLNTAGNGKKKAGAFTLDSLLKLNQTKAFDKKTTFLQYIVKIVNRNNELLLNFKDDLATVFKADKVAWEQSISDLEEVENQLENVRRIALYQARHAQAYKLRRKNKQREDDDESLSDAEISLSLEEEVEALKSTPVGCFTLSAIKYISALRDKVEETKSKFTSTLEYFGEEDAKMQPHELFSIIVSFCREFDKAKDDVFTMEKLRQREERKRQASAQSNHNGKPPQSTAIPERNQHRRMMHASNHQPSLGNILKEISSRTPSTTRNDFPVKSSQPVLNNERLSTDAQNTAVRAVLPTSAMSPSRIQCAPSGERIEETRHRESVYYAPQGMSPQRTPSRSTVERDPMAMKPSPAPSTNVDGPSSASSIRARARDRMRNRHRNGLESKSSFGETASHVERTTPTIQTPNPIHEPRIDNAVNRTPTAIQPGFDNAINRVPPLERVIPGSYAESSESQGANAHAIRMRRRMEQRRMRHDAVRATNGYQ